jgi:nitrogen fixation protein FixH
MTRLPTRLIPWLFVTGMAVVIAVNGVLVYFALGTWSGLVVEKPYERGIGYNRVLQAAAQQEALGWHFAIALEAGDASTKMVIQAMDRDGRALSGLNIRATVERPLERETHAAIELAEQGSGRYVAVFDRLRSGQWQTRVTATRGTEIAAAAHRQHVP